jgi:hypothetical protein
MRPNNAGRGVEGVKPDTILQDRYQRQTPSEERGRETPTSPRRKTNAPPPVSKAPKHLSLTATTLTLLPIPRRRRQAQIHKTMRERPASPQAAPALTSHPAPPGPRISSNPARRDLPPGLSAIMGGIEIRSHDSRRRRDCRAFGFRSGDAGCPHAFVEDVRGGRGEELEHVGVAMAEV